MNIEWLQPGPTNMKIFTTLIDAPYTIADGSGEHLASVVVDQSENPKEFNADGAAWDSLATVNVTGGQLTVNLGCGL